MGNDKRVPLFELSGDTPPDKFCSEATINGMLLLILGRVTVIDK